MISTIPIEKYYRHSGYVGVKGPFYIFSVGLLEALVLSAVYAYALVYITLVYITALLPVILGIIVGYLIGFLSKVGRIQNSFFVLLSGFVIGLFTVYGSWVSWIFAWSEQGVLILSPVDILHAIKVLSQEELWTFSGWSPHGIEYYIIWIIEAVVIVGFSTFFSWKFLSSKPFCTRCQMWLEDKASFSMLEPIVDFVNFKESTENGDYSALMSLKTVDISSNVFSGVELLHCPKCQDMYLLTVKSFVSEPNSNSLSKIEEKEVMKNLIIDQNTYKMIRQHFEELKNV